MTDARYVLVTGGAGYIGAHTAVELLSAGYHPVIIDNLSRSSRRLLEGMQQLTGQAPDFTVVDCTDADALRSVFQQHPGMRRVIHFAAYKSVGESVASPEMYYRNNLGSVLALLEVMREFGANELIFSSSCTVYGQPETIPVTEDTPFQKAESPYGATKQMSERILEDAVRAWPELRVIALRYFNPMGAHPSGWMGELPVGVPGNLVPFITQTAIGKREKVTIFGGDYDTPDGTCLRDYIHIMDLAAAHVRSLDRIGQMPNRYQPINVGSGNPNSVLELVKSFIKISGVNLPYSIGPRRPGDVVKIYADVSLAGKLLGWRTQYSAEQGLADAWRWEQQLKEES